MSAPQSSLVVAQQLPQEAKPAVGEKRKQVETVRDEKTGQIIKVSAPKKARTGEDQQIIVAENRDGSQVLGKHVKRTSSLQSPTMLLNGHEDGVLSCRFNSDGTHLVSAGKDRNIFVWEVYGDCKNEGVLKGHKKAILSVGWSHDGAHIYSVGADALTFDWDSHTGEVSRLFKGHIGIVNDVAPAVTGDPRIATASDDKTVRVWDSRAKYPQITFKHDYQMTSVAFSRDGTQLFTGGLDEVIRCWEVRTKTVLYELSGHEGTVTGLSLSPNGSSLLSSAADHTVRSWDVRPYVSMQQQSQQSPGQDSRHLKTFFGAKHDFQNNLLRCSWNADGSLVSSGSADGNVNIWDAHSAQLRFRLPGHKGCVNDTRFHPKEPIVLSASDDRSLFMGELNV